MDKKPNIILFLTDDHGQWANGAYGNQDVRTPTLDYLAANGALMENAYTPTPVCSPGRACLLTGRISSQHGLHDYLASGASPEIANHPWMGEEILLSQILQAHGYKTGLSGKWHLGGENYPQADFDYTFTYGLGYPIYHQGDRTFYENGKPEDKTGFMTELLTDKAIEFIRNEAPQEQPFFLTVGYIGTHSYWSDHPERLVEYYRKQDLDTSFQDSIYSFGIQNLESTFDSREDPREALAQYYAAVTHIDENVGRILDEVQALGLGEDTLIIYTSDHGLNCGHHNIWGKGNGTLPLNLVEESVRVPLILYHPDAIMHPQRRVEFVDHTDLFQTILDFTSIELDEKKRDERNYPGRSYHSRLVNDVPTGDWRGFQCCEYGDVRMIRDHRYKLVRCYPDGPNHLFDLEKDPRETTDLFNETDLKPVVDRLTTQLNAFYDKYADAVKSGLNVKKLPRHNTSESWRDPRNLH